jgi:hypothetical protein
MLPTVISARATLPSAGLACPKTVTFKFKISVPAAGTYYYRYVRSDGGRSSKIFQKTFAAAGEYDLPYNQDKPDYYWMLGKTYCGWTSIHFESVPAGDTHTPPSGALAHFTLNCPGDPNNATLPAPPDIGAWLGQHPTIANALKWQSVPNGNIYDTPTDAQKTSYPAWTQNQKDDLAAAFQNAFSWFNCGSAPKMSDDAPLTDKPENLVAPPQNPPTSSVARMKVKLAYGWKLYYESVAHALAAELHGVFPNWSILSYNADSLAALFDSALMGTNAGDFWLGTYNVFVPTMRIGNQPKTAYGPPRWIYSEFMKKNNLIGNTRLATIGNVLEWARTNLAHFVGDDIYQTFFDIWQYYGFPPISSIISGTTDPNNGFAHWTAGCHGSLGFYTAVLKAVNIPVRPVWVCGHELVFFPTENLYMDHGDDPYNLDVKNSPKPMTAFLIDEATYKSWFTSDLTVNILDENSPACANISKVTTMP